MLSVELEQLYPVPLGDRELADVEMIGIGAMSPLNGFMRQLDYQTVVDSMRLSDGLIWPLPVTLAVTDEQASKIGEGAEIALTASNGNPVALMHVTELYRYDKKLEAESVFGTNDEAHPGVARIHAQGDTLIAGPIWVIDRPNQETFGEYRLTPVQARQNIRRAGLEIRRRVSDAKSCAPRARVFTKGRAGDGGRSSSPSARRRYKIRRRTCRCSRPYVRRNSR